MKPGRLACCVPFCRRSTGRTEFTEWLCGEHWRLVDPARRQVYDRYVRRWRRYGPLEPARMSAADRIWRGIKSQAIHRAMVGVSHGQKRNAMAAEGARIEALTGFNPNKAARFLVANMLRQRRAKKK